jgi:AcrR family transcriptional regulator
VAAPTRSAESIRRDLTAALAATVADKGYAAATIADVVALAKVSKRTFYEHFADKEECMMALYDHVCDRLMLMIRGSGVPSDPWQRRVHDATAAYLSALDAMPSITRALLVEVQAAGQRAFRLRQQTLRKFARTLIVMVESGRPANPGMPELALPQALALVGGVNELLLHAVDPYEAAVPDDAGKFMALHPDVVRLVSAVLTYEAP